MFFDWLYAIGALVVSVGGGAGVVFGLFRFYGKVMADQLLEGVRAKYATELEKLKSDYRHEVESQLQTLRDQQERGQFVHRLQFEEEFKSYVNLWPCAHAVNRRARQLRPQAELTKIPDEERRKNLGEAFDAYRESFELRKPFLSPDVYDAAKRLDAAIFDEFWDWNRGREDRRHGEYWDTAIANQKRIIELTDAICDAIRARVGIIGPSIERTALDVTDATPTNVRSD